ncbi:MAG TPA: DUF2235 domain-containing protein [Scandinavium sp.]|jgi:uncharacterized protein (DUF2235 family)|uniref:DUF2235 domain-containing protein n=1 Tax=Scandinavium sp. TaxID=2830653 RepID=UPI002E37628C|nr:DUF2235 domain-containing protein [Scandinavium sp.]HEX4502523.1 DUF2235 domain-containing protein [Scandinavium sp.]
MSKNIIFCADGTWNGPNQQDDDDGLPDFTNVYRLYTDLVGVDDPTLLKLGNEQEKTVTTASGNVTQIAKYLHGVGDSRNWYVKIMGGVFGAGIIERIVRGYTFISRNYQKGDRIYLVGFSRGAYTVRALAGMIGKCGLLDASKLDLQDKVSAYRLGSAVWANYRKASGVSDSLFTDILLDAPHFFGQDIDPASMIYNVPIEAVAVWETVGSLGIPAYMNDKRVDLYRFADTKLGSGVRFGRQAIAIDEQRIDFTPTYWDPRSGIVQVLFSGIHADVGGGYSAAEDGNGLSNISYRWLRDELATLKVNLNIRHYDEDPLGRIHCEWGDGKPYKTTPRELNNPTSADMMIHQAAVTRLQSSQLSPVQQSNGLWKNQLYRPQALKKFTAPNWLLPASAVIAK